MAKKHIFDIKTNLNSLIPENLVLKRKYILNAMKLGAQSRSSSLIKILYDGDLQKQLFTSILQNSYFERR